MPFEILAQSDYILVKLTGECLIDEKPSLVESFTKVMEQANVKFAAVLCSECANVGTPFLRELAQVYKLLKALNGQIRLVSANPVIVTTIKTNGLDRILVNKLSLRGALVDFGLVKHKDFDVNFINPFLSATQKVLKVQCFLEAKPNVPYLKKATDPLLLGDISGIISITSETFCGSLAISLSEPIFCKIASNMLGEDIKLITEKNVDLVGELANMILGQAKNSLQQLGYGIQMALPSCIWGKEHKIKHFGAGICIVIPFETEAGTFYSEITTSNNQMAQLAKTGIKAA